ncbi:MAG: response regulator, partial [Planctomycetota bacterium]
MDEEKTHTDALASPDRGEPDLSALKALAVSRHAQTRELLQALLTEFGFGKVSGAEAVGDALTHLRNRPVDFVVADLEAHRLEEVDLVRNALALNESLPIMVISGHATIEWGVELMKAGVRDVIRKPLDVPVFRKKVFRLLEEGSGEGPQPNDIGPYHILEEIERGGMGVIYKAVNTKTEKTVALKVLPTSAHASMNQILRFRKEAEAISRLDHPYIVRLIDNGFAGKR